MGFSILVLVVFLGYAVAGAGAGDGLATSAIVYVFTMNHEVCHDMHSKQLQRWNSFPMYIKHTLNQALFTQPSLDTQLVFVTNYKNCSTIQEKLIDALDEQQQERLMLIDVSDIQSKRTEEFLVKSRNILQMTHGALWIAASARFFYLEDLMRQEGFKEVVHLEADNLLYAPLAPLLPSLRKHYTGGIAVTPMDANKSGMTASFMWVANVDALAAFNDHFLRLTNTSSEDWIEYTSWLRRYACCRDHSGIAEDEQGRGLRPYKINEMTILANYRRLHPDKLQSFPILPRYPYYRNRYTVNGSFFAPSGEEAGASIYDSMRISNPSLVSVPGADKKLTYRDSGWEDRVEPPGDAGSLFDPGSWGQYLGGTNMKRGSDRRFSDSSHIIGQAVTTNSCIAEMRCGNVQGIHYISSDSSGNPKCYQAPFVRCGSMENNNGTDMTAWHPLIHLHVHSKHEMGFLSTEKTCPCDKVGPLQK